jgi:hypothetical protein
MCTFLVSRGKASNNKVCVCDDWIDVPLGMLTSSVMCAAYLLVHGTVTEKKLIVHPESRIDVSSVSAVNNYGMQSKVRTN